MDIQPTQLLDLLVNSVNQSLTSINWSAIGLDELNASGLAGDEVDTILQGIMGAKRKDIYTVMTITVVYCVIFFTGIIGNICTCVVIARNAYMRSVTNYYLFSLAVSDVLTLIVGKCSQSTS